MNAKAKAALQLNIDAAQRELDSRNAEGEDVSHLRVDTATAKIVPTGKPLIDLNAPVLDKAAITKVAYTPSKRERELTKPSRAKKFSPAMVAAFNKDPGAVLNKAAGPFTPLPSAKPAVGKAPRIAAKAERDLHVASSKKPSIHAASNKVIGAMLAAEAKVANKNITINDASNKAKARLVAAETKALALQYVSTALKPTSKGATAQVVKLTVGMHELFMAYAQDACNWSDMPLVGGNVGGSKQDAGTLMHLKMRKLLRTEYEKDGGKELQWCLFTALGAAYAAAHGVTVAAKGERK